MSATASGADKLASREAKLGKVTDMDPLTLNNGLSMPALGLGVFQTPPQETRDAVTAALGAGYRHIDTAAAYGNEREVGEAVRAAEVDRDEVFWRRRSGSATTGTTRRCTRSTRAPASWASSTSTC